MKFAVEDLNVGAVRRAWLSMESQEDEMACEETGEGKCAGEGKIANESTGAEKSVRGDDGVRAAYGYARTA